MAVDFPANNQILTIGLYGSEESKDELVVLVDAISQKLINEVAAQQYARLMSQREQKTRGLNDLSEKIGRSSGSQGESNVLRQQWRKLKAGIETDDINLNAESRVILVEPATSSCQVRIWQSSST